MTRPLTTSSLDELKVHLAPSGPSEYLRYLIVTTLRRKGFNGAEAGALAEMERLLEHHAQRLFESASQYAGLANRSLPTAADALAAQDEALEGKRLKKESKRRRAALRLESAPGPSSTPQRTTLDLLVDFASEQAAEGHELHEETEHKPDLDNLDTSTAGGRGRAAAQRKGNVPAYAFDWAPGLPGTWMQQDVKSKPAFQPSEPETEPAPKVTSASMDFVKSTTVVGENIPPELGIVHFLKNGDRGKRRRTGGAGGTL